jgi:hypothetical protein
MKVLLDTNILIHRESNTAVNDEFGTLFNWFDRLHYTKCVHPISIKEIQQHQDKKLVHSMEVKLKSYSLLQTEAPINPQVQVLIDSLDRDQNAINDSRMLNELVCGRVDLFITEDRGIHSKANLLSIPDKVFTIDSFLEKVMIENPGFVEYKIPSVKREFFGQINLSDPFFDQFKEDYVGFADWFNKKSDEQAYVCKSGDQIIGFLYLKEEREGEDYSNISPPFHKAKRLKIGTMKVAPTSFRLGERFIKIIIDNALNLAVDEIYITVFPKRVGQFLLIGLLQDWGFKRHGTKETSSGIEEVFVRDFKPSFNSSNPNLSYPYMSLSHRTFIVPIYEKYHTELFPDSILRTESPLAFVENQPHRNSIRKVYISRSIERNLNLGDIVVFYRTGGYYEGVVSTLGIIENIVTEIKDEQDFISLCRQRSVFSDKELLEYWNYNLQRRPFIVNFLYAYSFPKRPNLKRLIELNIIPTIKDVPRGFSLITGDQLRLILKEARANESLIID